MLNEVKHLGLESLAGIVAVRVSRTMPRSFAAAQDDSDLQQSTGPGTAYRQRNTR